VERNDNLTATPVLLLFFVSGATALIYEVIWSKHLALMFGSTVQAQTVVLAVFMGGLALGNKIFGKRAGFLKQPLAAYGYIEAVIGIYAALFPKLYAFADTIFVTLGSKVAENSTALLLIKAVLSVSLLIIPTVLMGGTLPLLAAWLERRETDAGRGSAQFYSTNSLGAVFGAGLAGFFLVRKFGLTGSLQYAAAANFIIAGLAILFSRKAPAAPQPVASAPEHPILPPRAALAIVAITGGVSMGLEVGASRAVALVGGGSVQACASVLMAFILGRA
jgi:spermidine synthase